MSESNLESFSNESESVAYDGDNAEIVHSKAGLRIQNLSSEIDFIQGSPGIRSTLKKPNATKF